VEHSPPWHWAALVQPHSLLVHVLPPEQSAFDVHDVLHAVALAHV
jgi:hypothetical protein